MHSGPQPTSTGAAQITPRLPGEVWVLVAVSFVIAVGFGIVAPAIPSFARSFVVSVTVDIIVIIVFMLKLLSFASGIL